MDPVQIIAVVVSLAISVVAIALFVKAVRHIIAVVRLGQPTPNRSADKGARWRTMLKETLAHTRMLQWAAVGVGHWFVFIGFGLLFFTLVTAYGQLFDPHFAIPFLGTFFLYEWVSELFAVVMTVAIIAFIAYRASRPADRERGTRGRFYGSTMWQGYFVEAVILGVGLCILVLRGAEYAIGRFGEDPGHSTALHFPFTAWLGGLLDGLSEPALANLIWIVATLKIVISMVWMIVLAMNTTMGVAWHRFTAWFNIWFKRKADGGTALGALQPMMAGGKPIDFADIDELDEDTALGVGKVEDFAWKGILDFTSCTECGRCQSQCPAWNTDKPLSPKLLITQLRDHAYAKAPYLLADSDPEREALPAAAKVEAERELVGATEGYAWMPDGGAVIDPDVLWSCTSCGACVQQCPVDIEHVDHIVDMRRYQVLVESNFPTELNQLFKGLENKGNPWNMSPTARMDWAKGLDFDVKVVGGDGENDPADLDGVDWLFWVGCAGAYEDRAKKTTRAVAELLHLAEVDFAVLGNGETCTGDPARRAGNEFVFQQLAMQNAEVFKESRATKVVSTCAHCFNTLKNEYAQFGVELEVVHHTQLLNRLVREGRLTPIADGAAANGGGRSITYHDPCYLGRHNQVYSPPRELLTVLPNAELKEMPRNSERSFCCGAGGARMWMEEKLGERINLNRTSEAVETGADQIATGCPFCRVMLSDGLTAKQADGSAREEVEVLDVAQLLLASVKGEQKAPVGAGVAAGAGAAAGAAAKAEPSSGDATQTPETVTRTEEVGANAAAGAETAEAAEAAEGSGAGEAAKAAPAGSGSSGSSGGTGGSAGSGDLFGEPENGGLFGDAEPGDRDFGGPGSPGDAAATEPAGAAASDPDSTDVTAAEEGGITEAESTAPSDDAAVQTETSSPAQPAPKSKPATGGDSLFGDEPAQPAPESKPATGGDSLFGDEPAEPEPEPKPKPEPKPAPKPKDADSPGLFDEPEPESVKPKQQKPARKPSQPSPDQPSSNKPAPEKPKDDDSLF
ncbi:MAG TPA: heterodisulfide reductase-related iron-sulfur binding cluster [Nocardioidaceae bacterium]|nr:heterodisulfide reductase-related iron-sulfur binding cluster [Nocardioidaceae bacterium]